MQGNGKPEPDRTPVQLRPGRQHGTYVAYVASGCRCVPCAKAKTAYENNRHRQIAYGRWGEDWTDAEPVRAHVQMLRQNGIGTRTIAQQTGVSRSSLSRLLHGNRGYGPSKRMRKDLAEAIMAVGLDAAPGGTRIGGFGAARRCQALVALGWSQSKIAQRAGMTPANFTAIFWDRGRISRDTERRIREAYDDLSMRLPPAETREDRGAITRAKGMAAHYGWLPPLAYDEDQLDDPTFWPTGQEGETAEDEVLVENFLEFGDKPEGRWTRAQRLLLVPRLIERGWTHEQIFRRFGWKADRYTKEAS